MCSDYKSIFNEYYTQGQRNRLIIDLKNYKKRLKEIGVDTEIVKKCIQEDFGEDIKELGISDDEY